MPAHKAHETTIAMGVKVEGDFTSDGDVVIEGEVAGTVKTKGHLLVGEAAVIRANVEAKSADVSGKIEGNIKVEEKMELKPSASVEGDVSASILAVAPGAQLNGTVKMGGGIIPSVESEDDE